jgi:hypothetical protein
VLAKMKWYVGYSGLVLSGLGYAQYRGLNLFAEDDVVRNVPKSVRDNPGSYRSIYTYYPRYSGGK